jgi:hypothetical protein
MIYDGIVCFPYRYVVTLVRFIQVNDKIRLRLTKVSPKRNPLRVPNLFHNNPPENLTDEQKKCIEKTRKIKLLSKNYWHANIKKILLPNVYTTVR